MKKIMLLLAHLILLNVIGFSQLLDKEIIYQKTIIAGKIKKYRTDGKLQQINLYLSRPEENRLEVHRVEVAPNGTFSIPIELAFPQEMIVDYKARLFVYANPGDSIYLDFNGAIWKEKKLLKNIKFSGDSQIRNEEWTEFKRTYLTAEDSAVDKAQKEKNFDDFHEFMLNHKKELEENIAIFARETEPSVELIDWLKNKSKLDYSGHIIRYPIAHAIYNQLKEVEVKLPETYDAFMLELSEISLKDLSNASSVAKLIAGTNNAIARKIRRENAAVTGENWHELFANGFDEFNGAKSSLFYELMLSQRAFFLIKIGEIEIYKKYYEPLVKKYVQQEFLSTKIRKRLEEKLYYINNPLAASEAIVKNLRESNEENPFNEILNDHKGKVVYLDFWGTWCGPCIAEFPNSKKLHQDFKTENMVFVYACIDSKKNAWKKDLKKYQLKGSHYFFNKKQSDEIRKVLEINGIPFYLIIDENGNIIDKGSHLRPSFKETKEKLNLLLK